MIPISDNTRIIDLTVGQLLELLSKNTSTDDEKSDESFDPNEHVYGLKGIADLFHVSHTTAQMYKNTFLKPAVRQFGRKIITNKKLAIELFNERNR